MTNSNPSNQVVSKIVDGNTLVLERVFQAPRELVFKAFSEAEHLKHWWGPKVGRFPYVMSISVQGYLALLHEVRG